MKIRCSTIYCILGLYTCYVFYRPSEVVILDDIHLEPFDVSVNHQISNSASGSVI